MDIVTGEKIQSIADIVLIDKHNPKNSKYSKKIVFYDKNLGKNIEQFNDAKIIFVKIDFVDAFAQLILPHIKNKIVLITHNGDYCVDDRYINIINDEKIIHWFGQNVNIIHPKVTPVPIGIANSQWKHGNLQTLQNVIDMKIPKTKLIYVNFTVETNSKIREPVKKILIDNGYTYTNPKLDNLKYLEELSSHKFAVSPEGNGFDCHRIWECLYLGVIPIVMDIVAYKSYDSLPILKINDWNVISDDFLNEQYEIMSKKTYDMSLISFKYWENLIKSFAQQNHLIE